MQNYRVTIYFKEPVYYELKGKDPETTREFGKTFAAENEEDATSIALSYFAELAEKSSVKWERRIVEVKAREVK